MEISSSIDVHSPDLLFVNSCITNFGINRGIYNTIESWFYQKGYDDIIQRRKMLILFLHYVSENRKVENKTKFGHGGLISILNEFYENKRKVVS